MHEVQYRGALPAHHLIPSTLDGALELLAEHGSSARLVAGGTDLILEFARRQHPEVDVLIDITALAGLDQIEFEDETVTIGPLVTHNQIVGTPVLWQRATPLAQACWEIGSPQLRNRATVVGNVVTASPANDTITPLRVLDAVLTVRSVGGERHLPLDGFHTGVRSTLLEPDEMVTAITFRTLRHGERGLFLKAGNRMSQAISVVHAALVFDPDLGPASARVALGSVAPTILEFAPPEPAVFDDAGIAEFAASVVGDLQPIDDVRATADYRLAVAEAMIRRGFTALRDGEVVPAPEPVLLSSSGSSHRAAGAAAIGRDEWIQATVNGREVSAGGAAGKTLLDWLRDDVEPEGGSALTGTKEGCAEGECGACTVQMNGAAVMACLVPAARAHGADIVTVEGIERPGNGQADRLHPVQRAFIDHTAVQCGFCIPGFIVAAASLLDEKPQPSRQEIVDALGGNLCRCTGYYKIIDAIEAAGGSS